MRGGSEAPRSLHPGCRVHRSAVIPKDISRDPPPAPAPCTLEGRRGTRPLSKTLLLEEEAEPAGGQNGFPWLLWESLLVEPPGPGWKMAVPSVVHPKEQVEGPGHLGPPPGAHSLLEEAVTMASPREGVPRVPKRPSVTGRASSAWLQISGQSSWRW